MIKNNIFNNIIKSKRLIICIYKCIELYFKFGSRSSKKTDHLHLFIKQELDSIILSNNWQNTIVKLESNVNSISFSNKKKCDIVIYQLDKPIIVIPVKMIMTNYLQNRNNYWENLTGELMHLNWVRQLLIKYVEYLYFLPSFLRNSITSFPVDF